MFLYELRYREYSFELRTPERKDEKREKGTAKYNAKEILEPNAAPIGLRSD